MKNPAEQMKDRVIYLLTRDSAWARELIDQLNYFNYAVRVFSTLSELQKQTAIKRPIALMIDMECSNPSLVDWIKKIKVINPQITPLPIIYVTDDESLRVHLEAIRHEGDAFFIKPVDIMSLATRLDLLCGIKPVDPYRILIVEDSASLSQFYAAVLQKADMQTEIVTDPLQIKKALIEFKPELILMDIYMPQCTGIELANIIRQLDVFTTIPIIYLSSEEDKEQQMLAMRFGCDDFLLKPILPEDLVQVVQRRVQRARALSSLVNKDSLTGLLNHTAIHDVLKSELARAERNTTPLSFAMLDLDHFKKINDLYGHQVGDFVITTLCRIILKRLRSSDIAGRYGGEEFALIFPDTPVKDAMKICDEIRNNLFQLKLSAKGEEFSVSFSCGLAAYPPCNDVTNLIHSADTALYAAKQKGRNKVIIFDES